MPAMPTPSPSSPGSSASAYRSFPSALYQQQHHVDHRDHRDHLDRLDRLDQHQQSPPATASTRTSTAGSSAPSVADTVSASVRAPAVQVHFSRDDTDRARAAYEDLAASAKTYRVALGQLSQAASGFGAALEACARLKEARAQPYPPGPAAFASSFGGFGGVGGGGVGGGGGSGGGGLFAPQGTHEATCTADVLLAASGLYFLMANQQGILAETVYRAFELPVVHELDRFAADVEAEQAGHAADLRDASRAIRRLEKEGVQLRRPRQREVGRMRAHLAAMTGALDALTERQAAHAAALLAQSRDMSGAASQAARNLVRAEVDILDALARKGWPGGGLDVVLDGAVDVFARDADDSGEVGYVYDAGVPGLLGGTLGATLGGGLDRFAPKPLLGTLEGSGAHPDGRAGTDHGDDDADDDCTVDQDSASEASTIDGRRNGSASDTPSVPPQTPPPQTGGGLFRILRAGSILGRGLATRKESVAAPVVSDAAPASDTTADALNALDADADLSTPRPVPASRPRADSLAVDTDAGADTDTTPTATPATAYRYADEHQYQSLDSLASEHALAQAQPQPKPKPRAGRPKKKGRGRSRPFSPPRIVISPHDDLFSDTDTRGADNEGASRAEADADEAERRDSLL